MKKLAITVSVLSMVWVLGISVVQAAGSDTKEDVADDNVVRLTISGENYCLRGFLKNKGECDKSACQHALRVLKAKDSSGKIVKEMKGWTLHYLKNEASSEYQTGHHGEKVKVTGTIFKAERVIDLSEP